MPTRPDDESEAHMFATAEHEAWAADSDDEDRFGPSPADRHGIAGADDDEEEEEPIPHWMTAGGYLPPQGTTEADLPSYSAASHSVPNPALSCPSGTPRTLTSRPRAFSKSSFELIEHRDAAFSHRVAPRLEEDPSQSHGDTSEQHENIPGHHGDSSKQHKHTAEQYKDTSAHGEDNDQEQEDAHNSHDDWDNFDDGDDSDFDFSRAVSPADAMDSDNENHGEDWQQAGENADARDLAGIGIHGRLDVSVGEPRKENEGTQNQYISYLVTTDTDFKSFQSSHITTRRRFTDFVFLYKTLCREYPQCAVPPLPDKHKMEYVRGDRFGQDFTAKRAHSLERFCKRLSLHPVLRRAVLFVLFLESNDWNATMKSRPTRGMSAGEAAPTGFVENWTDSILNAFTRPHKTDRRFVEVREHSDKLDEDLATVSKTVARVARRESDLEQDYADIATQFQKLAELEPGVGNEMTSFSSSLNTMSNGWKGLREHTDQNYLGSLKDMEAFCSSVKALLKTREQKQLDFEGLSEYQNKAVTERDNLASHANMGASGFIRAKIEDVRGVDHEAARRERVRKLEVQIRRLQDEVEGAKKTSEAFDEEVVKETADFERIKAIEFKDTLGALADANIDFFKGTIETWEGFLKEMEREDRERGQMSSD